MGKEAKLTPLMRQYLDIKNQNKDSILFFRMGDFYELFFEDAKIASEVLGITLTSRANGKAAEVPLAGFPYHSLDTYLAKMVRAGYRVAICEQVEDPKKAKTIVKRAITEIVTPGTVLTDELLDSRSNNFLTAVYFLGDMAGVATVDISTGEFSTGEYPSSLLRDQIERIQPAEILVPEEQSALLRETTRLEDGIVISTMEGWLFGYDFTYEKLTSHFNTLTLKGFGCEDLNAGISAAGAVLHYLQENQKTGLEHIAALQREEQASVLGLDSATRRNLEIVQALRGGRKGTLISVVDKTATPMGARLLVRWLQTPLRNVAAINSRLDAVEELQQNADRLEKVRGRLAEIGDLERLITKVITQRANARDLNALANSMQQIPWLLAQLDGAEASQLNTLASDLDPLDALVSEIKTAIVDDPPLAITDGGVLRKGYNDELDKLREIAYSGKDWILRLQASEREKTGIPSLKVSFNKVFGYYIEVTKPHLPKVPEHYIRKQTLVNAERFIVAELKEYEEQILGAQEKIFSLEYSLFQDLRARVASHATAIQQNGKALAALDCLSNFAYIAIENRYARPQIDKEDRIEIVEGRHPVIEKLLPFGENFVPNDTHIDCGNSQIQIITGPNMAGKSTYLRQVALLVLMAQAGSFVPARSAKIGAVDKIFTRVGASDNLAAGESTFLVEMNETANILNNATAASLILLDEIGRGTSTFDGLSIAWSIVEYLHDNSKVAAKTMFATHYHELTELELILERVKNYNIAVKEWGEQIVFLRKIVEGGTDHSYGIQVAKLAGLPREVIRRAREVLGNLEQNALTPNHKPKLALKKDEAAASAPQLNFFDNADTEIVDLLRQADLENMTPLEAFQLLITLRDKSRNQR